MGHFPTGAKGRARVDPRNPDAYAICDRCGFQTNRSQLTWEMQFAGVMLQNKRFLVCHGCLDIPNPQLLSYNPGADPLPIRDPRPRIDFEGFAPIVIYTKAGLTPRVIVDGNGTPIVTSGGQMIGTSELVSRILIAANPERQRLSFMLPAAFGIWLNPTGGSAFPGASGASFYAAGSAYEAFDAASQPAMTYYTTIAGLLIVVESQ